MSLHSVAGWKPAVQCHPWTEVDVLDHRVSDDMKIWLVPQMLLDDQSVDGMTGPSLVIDVETVSTVGRVDVTNIVLAMTTRYFFQ